MSNTCTSADEYYINFLWVFIQSEWDRGRPGVGGFPRQMSGVRAPPAGVTLNMYYHIMWPEVCGQPVQVSQGNESICVYQIVLIFRISPIFCPSSVSEQFAPADRPVSAYGFRPDEQFFYNYNTASR